ncbi:MAG: BREX system Lon protease-like protein BrxL, partial [Opitutales bacterium]
MLDQKIIQHFAGYVVRKDLSKIVKGNAVVPSYVLEYLLGQYCSTDDKDNTTAGIDSVKDILAKHYVHRNEAELVKSTIREKGRHKVIDKLTVELNDKSDVYEAKFSNLRLKGIATDADYVKKHPKLLVGGVWCIVDVLYEHSEDKEEPWVIDKLKPIQVSHFDYDEYCTARAEFSTDEWIDVLVQTIGFDPQKLTRRQKFLQLARLIPFCERNYNYIELGPKGTGKSHIFSEFSPHGMIVSGGEISVAKLFVNNATGKPGLVGYWDSVAFDEFAGKDKRVDKNLVDIMKGYMANKSFSRGVEVLGAEASMSFLGNTSKSVEYMLRHSNFFDDLPDKYIDSAFLDRLHMYSPGWETSVIRSELFTDGFGFIVDYLAEALKNLRTKDYSQAYAKHFSLSTDISIRDRDGIHKTFSGLVKVIFPNGECGKEETKELLSFAVEGRKRVKDHITRLDSTFPDVRFAFTDLESGDETLVQTTEEIEHPDLAKRGGKAEGSSTSQEDEPEPVKEDPEAPGPSKPEEEKKNPWPDGESNEVEFKSTLRVNLHTGDPDTRIELSVLKTIAAFLNTRGGCLVIGLNDEAKPLGLEADKFKSEDNMSLHLVNIVNARLGPLAMTLTDVCFDDCEGKRIMVVKCEKSNKPIFCKDADREFFFVRTGPSTTQL